MATAPTLSVSIMAHPSRANLVANLFPKLGGPVPVAWDDGDGITVNCRSAWELRGASDYHLVLQDDAILCSEFLPRARFVLSNLSKLTAVSFYMGWRPELVEEQKLALWRGFAYGPLRWGIAICLPADWIPDMLNFFSRQVSPRDDTRIKQWLVRRNRKTYYPMPSLVDHRADIPSLVGDDHPERKAYAFAGE